MDQLDTSAAPDCRGFHGTPEEVERTKDLLDQAEANSATVHGDQLAAVGA